MDLSPPIPQTTASQALPSPPPPWSSKRPPRFLSHADTVRLINRQSDHQRALDIFNSAAAQPGFSHYHATYSAVVLRLARARKFLAVDDLLRRMALEPCRFHEALFLLLMPLFARASVLEKTLYLFHSIAPIVRQKPSPKAVATCLDLLVVSGGLDLAQKLLSDAKIKFDIVPNTSFINILVKKHCKAGDLDSAFKVLEKMRKSKLAPPNLITYSTLMGGLRKEGKLKDAFQLFDEMIERDRIVPDPLTYNVLIDRFCRQGQVEKGRKGESDNGVYEKQWL